MNWYNYERKYSGGVKLKKFTSTLIISLVVFTLFITIGTASYVYEKSKEISPYFANQVYNPVTMEFEEKEEPINMLVMGVDEQGIRTDVMFVIRYDIEKNKINLLSIPRDTKYKVDSELYKILKFNYNIPENKIVKLNEIHAYAGSGIRNKATEYAIESLLGIKIDKYIKFNLSAFKKIVDGVGGIEMYVPQDMYYSDPQQNLYINLKEGRQKLTGDTAEQLVRFRKGKKGTGYLHGDIDRVSMQQEFIKAFFKNIKDKDKLLNVSTINNLIRTYFDDVETNFQLHDLLRYSKYIVDIDTQDIKTETLKGDVGSINGLSYYLPSNLDIQKAVNRLYNESTNEQETINEEKSKEYKIIVENGGEIPGLAAFYEKKLKSEGYNVIEIGNYEGEADLYTRIIVKSEEAGRKVQKFFELSIIDLAPNKLEEADIKIILGTQETKK